MEKQFGSDIFCQTIMDENIEMIFGIPGGVILPLYDKLNQHGHKFKHILPRQEQGGGFAADGYARATGKVGMAIGTSGPGATNLMTCIINSMLDSVPVVYITGQVIKDLTGTDAFQEADIIGMSISCVKHSYFVTHARDIQRVLKEAVYLAKTGRPGPVHVDIAKDAWISQAVYEENPIMDLPGYVPIPEICSDLDIKRIDKLLSENNVRPIIIAGHGIEISRAQKELLIFAENQNIPVVNTLLGLGNFPQGNPLWLGMLGMHGDAVANYAVDDANLIIGIGTRFSDRIIGRLETFLKDKVFVHIDIDPSEIDKIVSATIPLPGDANDVLSRANNLLNKHSYTAWWEKIAKWKEKYGFLDFTVNPEHNSNLLSQPRLIKMISDATDGEAIVASDVGRNQMWTGRFYRFKHPNSYLSSGGLGSMGYGLPAAIGAKFGVPDREVWTVSGDGGFMMNMQELGTVAEHKLPIKIAIMEDKALGMVRQWQKLLFKGNISHTDLVNPDFVKLADAFGIQGFKASTYKEAAEAIEKARSINGPALITFQVDPDEHVFPMVPPNTPLKNQCLKDEDLTEKNEKNLSL
ncbi:MAG: biosynthetic-type acetolactate synthase large subunit [Candidatus Gracilibacteria bacterium]|jgi:acetolactate synthase-1/2/3 large subunit